MKSKVHQVYQSEIIEEIAKRLKLKEVVVRDVLDAQTTITKREMIKGHSVIYKGLFGLRINDRLKKSVKCPEGVIIRYNQCTVSRRFRAEINAREVEDKIERSDEYGEFKNIFVKRVISEKATIFRINAKLVAKRFHYNRLAEKFKKLKEDLSKVKKARYVDKRLYKKEIAELREITKAVKPISKVYMRKEIARASDSYFLDGVTTYPIISQYLHENRLNFKIFNFFVIVNHFTHFYVQDAYNLGFNYPMVNLRVNTLMKMGWIEQFGTKRKYYVVSLIGKREFEKFQTYCNDKMVLLDRKRRKKAESELNRVRKFRAMTKFTGNYIEDEETKVGES